MSSNAVTGAGGQGVLAVMGAGRRPRQSKQQVLGHGNVNVKAPSVTVTPVASSNAGMDNAMKSYVIVLLFSNPNQISSHSVRISNSSRKMES